MPDREKVANGLECCQHSSKSYCDRCPYLSSTNDCTADLASDAIALLKEQEEQIERLEHDLDVAQNDLYYYVNGNG